VVGAKGTAQAGTFERLHAIRNRYRTAHRLSWKSIRRAAKAVLGNKRNWLKPAVAFAETQVGRRCRT